MPTIIRIGGYQIEMHSGREHGIPHVHVVHEDRDVVVNLLTLEPFGVEPFWLPRNVKRYIEVNQTELLRRWDEYHG